MANAWQCDICKKIFISGASNFLEKRELRFTDSHNVRNNYYDVCNDCVNNIIKGIYNANTPMA